MKCDRFALSKLSNIGNGFLSSNSMLFSFQITLILVMAFLLGSSQCIVSEEYSLKDSSIDSGGSETDLASNGLLPSESNMGMMAAVNSYHKVKYIDMPSVVHGPPKPQVITVSSTSLPMKLLFRTTSSRLQIDQVHQQPEIGVKDLIQHKRSRLRPTYRRPIIQEIHDEITPFPQLIEIPMQLVQNQALHAVPFPPQKRPPKAAPFLKPVPLITPLSLPQAIPLAPSVIPVPQPVPIVTPHPIRYPQAVPVIHPIPVANVGSLRPPKSIKLAKVSRNSKLLSQAVPKSIALEASTQPHGTMLMMASSALLEPTFPVAYNLLSLGPMPNPHQYLPQAHRIAAAGAYIKPVPFGALKKY